jgi:multicomponent Na+:H+ antiporter subunit F
MDVALQVVALFLLLNLSVGLVRVLLGPTSEDRMVATLLFGTTGVALILVLADLQDSAPVRDVALVFVVLAALATIAFGTRGPSQG